MVGNAHPTFASRRVGIAHLFATTRASTMAESRPTYGLGDFSDLGGGSYRVESYIIGTGSPCYNMASNAKAELGDHPYDIRGMEFDRLYNSATVDMGCYEYQP